MESSNTSTSPDASRVPRWAVLLVVLGVLATGAGYSGWTVLQADRGMREDLLAQARRLAQGLDPNQVQALSGTEDDLVRPEYQRLKRQLGFGKRVHGGCRFVYLMGRRDDGRVFFLADSEAPGSPGYSPPGQPYPEAGEAEAALFTNGAPLVEGPTTDRWGTWFSASVPLVHPHGQQIRAVLGMDVDVQVWQRSLVRAGLPPALLTLALATILLLAVVLLARRRRLAAAAPRWLRRLEPGLAVTLGLLLTGFAAWTMYEHEADDRDRSFTQLADSETDRVGDLIRRLRDHELDSIARFYDSSTEVTWAEFRHFVEPLTRNPAVHAWEWIPALTTAEARQMEQSVRAAGLPAFEIWERDGSGTRVPAQGREVYYPVLHVAPLAGNESALGFDVGSEPSRRATLEEAAHSRLTTSTEPITLVQETEAQNGMAIFQPIYRAEEPERLRGFAVAVLRLGALLQAVQDNTRTHLEITLPGDDGTAKLLASSCTAVGRPAGTPRVARPVAAFGKLFLISAHGASDLGRHHALPTAAAAALVGLLLTAALTLLVGAPLRRREELERLVEARTADLRKEEERLAALFRSMGDGVIETDSAERVVSLNRAAERLTGWTTATARGQPLGEVFPAVAATPPPEGAEAAGGAAPGDTSTGLGSSAALVVTTDRAQHQLSSRRTPIHGPGGDTIGNVLVFRDVTREHRAQQQMQIRLALLEYATSHSADELLKRALDAISEVLDSPIGFYHFVDADQEALPLRQWSTRTLLEFSQTGGEAGQGGIVPTGLLADCVRKRKPLIHNDSAAMLQRHGLPGAQVPVIREMVVPALRGQRVVAVLGVANKPFNYTGDDIKTAGYLGDLVWQILVQKHTELALRESKARYEQLAALSRTFTWEVDTEGLYTYVSATVTQVLGYQPEELVGKLRYDDLHPEAGREGFKAAMLGVAVHQERLDGVENAALTRDGRLVWLCTNGIPCVDRDGKWVGYRGSDTDITARRQTEQNYQTLFREMRNGFAVHEIICDAEGKPTDYRFLAMNPAFERMTGLAAREVVGKTVMDVFPSTEPFWVETYGKVALSGESVSFEQPSGALGKTFEVSAFRPAPGQFACIVTDISERKRMEAEREQLMAAGERSRRALLSVLEDEKRLAAERARLAAGIEQAGEVVLITDPAGNIQYANPAFEVVTGYRRDEVMGRNPRLLKSGQHDAAVYRELWDTISGGRVWKGRLVNRRKDGTLYTVDTTISPVRDAAGQIANYVAVKRDVTEHLQVAEQLQQAQKMESVGRLAGGVAHDFNNLLMGIMNYVELCRDKIAPDHPIREYLDEITTDAQRSANLTRQLLAFARKQLIRPKVVDLNDAVTNMLNLLRRLIGENIDLAWAPGPDLWPIMVDPGQIDQVLANLCVNARDAIPGAGKVAIRTGNVTLDQGYCSRHVGSIPGEYVHLAVSDDGCGMTTEVLDHIFEPFFTTKGVGKGTGLGLATVYGIVTQNAGFLSVDSEPSKGATFHIYLPRTLGQDVSKNTAPAKRTRPRGDETILLVEDERSLLVTSRMFLESLGYTVLPAEDPAAAIALVEQHAGTIHLLLTDVVMPGMSGKDLADHLVTLRPGLPCLFMSGYTADAIAHTGVLDGGVRFLAKPFSRDSLADQVRKALDNRKLG